MRADVRPTHIEAWITANMMRSQLAVLVKQVMGRVRRRISRKARSIAFVSGMKILVPATP